MNDNHVPEREYWLENPANVRRLIWGLVAVCVSLVVADLFYDKHVHYGIQHWPGFDAVFGFASYVFLVFAAVGLRRILKRSEDYYD